MFQQFHRWAVAGFVPALGALLLTSAPTPARAAAVFDIAVLNATAYAGGTGSFDVTLTSTSGDAVDLGGFQLELSVAPGSGVQFTDATTSTADTYIFAGNSGVGPGSPFVSTSTPLPGGDVQVSDINLDPNSASVNSSDSLFGGGMRTDIINFNPTGGGYGQQPTGGGPGGAGTEVFGLAHVTFSVAAGTAAGPIAVSIAPYDSTTGAGTLLSDTTGNTFFEYSSTNGTITVTASAVPEPSGLLLAATALGIGLACLRRGERTK